MTGGAGSETRLLVLLSSRKMSGWTEEEKAEALRRRQQVQRDITLRRTGPETLGGRDIREPWTWPESVVWGFVARRIMLVLFRKKSILCASALSWKQEVEAKGVPGLWSRQAQANELTVSWLWLAVTC